MTSKTNICNQALLLLGEDLITDIDEGTTAANICKTFYDTSKLAVLEEHEWNFATARATFTLDAATPVYEWDYQHVLETDCARVLEIDTLKDDQWQVEGRRLLSNLSVIKARYIRNDVGEGEFTAMFVKALAAYLAAEMAYPICESNSKSDQMLGRYAALAVNAGHANKLEGSTTKTSPGRLQVVRGT